MNNKMKKDTLQFYKKPELKIYGTVHEMTKGNPVIGSSGVAECPTGTTPVPDGEGGIESCI